MNKLQGYISKNSLFNFLLLIAIYLVPILGYFVEFPINIITFIFAFSYVNFGSLVGDFGTNLTFATINFLLTILFVMIYTKYLSKYKIYLPYIFTMVIGISGLLCFIINS